MKRGAVADDRGGRGIRVVAEAAVGLLGDHGGPFTIARQVKRVNSPHIHPRHTNPGRGSGTGLRLAQLDGPLPVCCRLRVTEDPFRIPGRRHPGGQFLGGAARGLPVPGYLRGQHLVGGGRQRPRRVLVQRRPLPGQKPASHCLGQQRMPRPVRTPGGVVGEEPGRRQFP